MKLTSTLPRGVAALLFETAARLRAVESRLVDELAAVGFGEAILPVLDYAAPYEPLLPPAARAELFRFADPEGELLALRGDFTPLVARLLAPHLAALELPLRLFYRGETLRRVATSGGRRGNGAELGAHELGGELVGRDADGEALEREATLLFARLLSLATAGEGRLVLGFAGALDELLQASAGAAGAAGAAGDDCAEADVAELARAIARREVGAANRSAAGAALVEVVERGVPERREALGARGAAAVTRLEALAAEIATATPELAVSVDLAEFADFADLSGAGGADDARSGRRDERDLAPAFDLRSYYGGVVFRGYLPRVARPVASGGRYDRLYRRLGGAAGAELAAVGFSFRLEPLAERANGAADSARRSFAAASTEGRS